MNMYEKIIRNKVRFECKGIIAAEDLWDLSLVELDGIYKKLNATKKLTDEDSLLETKTTENKLVDTQIEFVKYVVETKQAEANASKLAIDRKMKKEKIMSMIARKQDSELEEKSAEELQEMLNSL